MATFWQLLETFGLLVIQISGHAASHWRDPPCDFIKKETQKVVARLLSRVNGSVDVNRISVMVLALGQKSRLTSLPRFRVTWNNKFRWTSVHLSCCQCHKTFWRKSRLISPKLRNKKSFFWCLNLKKLFFFFFFFFGMPYNWNLKKLANQFCCFVISFRL